MAFTIRRGTNISHWLSQSDDRGEVRKSRLRREDVQRLKGWGFDHLRLPIDEEQMWTVEGKREAEAFDLLDEALDWCHEAGLRAVVDLHILRSHHFLMKAPPLYTDPKAAEQFAGFWTDLSAFLGRRSIDEVAYELMNEPVAIDHQDWNRVFLYPYRAIREREPNRVIMVGSNRWQACDTFDALEVPKAEWVKPGQTGKMILTFHFYLPLLFTHYKANWCEQSLGYEGPICYPGKPVPEAELAKCPEELRNRLAANNDYYDIAVMEKQLAKPLAVSQQTGLPLYCGEFGVYNSVPDELRIRWYRDFIKTLDKHHIGWANRDFRGGFAVVDAHGKPTAVLTGLGLGK